MNENDMTAFRYRYHQVDLACLDTLMTGDTSDYRVCLEFAGDFGSLGTIGMMFGAFGAMTFEGRDYETVEDRAARFAHDERAAQVVEHKVAA